MLSRRSAARRAPRPTSPNGRRLFVVALSDSLGTGMFLAGSVVLFTTVLHLSGAQIGRGVAAAGAVGLVVAVGWGVAADAWGARRVLALLQLWRAAGFAAYVFVHGFFGYLLVTVFLGIAEKANSPLTLAVVSAAVPPAERLPLAARLRSVRNVGFTGGALLASVALLFDNRTALIVVVLGNAMTFVVAAFLLGRMPLRGTAVARRRDGAVRGARVLRRPAFCLTALVSGILSVHRSILGVGLPLWIATHTTAPKPLVTVLIAVNTGLTLSLQVRMSRSAESVPVAARALRRAALMLSLAVVAIAASGSTQRPAAVALLGAGIVLLTFGEMWHSAGAWGLSMAFAPAHAPGRFLTAFNQGAAALDICGALLITGLVLPAGALGWLAVGGVLLVVGLCAVPLAAWANREAHRADRAASAEGPRSSAARTPFATSAPLPAASGVTLPAASGVTLPAASAVTRAAGPADPTVAGGPGGSGGGPRPLGGSS